VGLPSIAARSEELRTAAATDNFVVIETRPNDDFAPYRGLLHEAEMATKDPDVGDEVVVADQGKTYQASVAGRNADGSFKLSFSGTAKPARDSFRKEEMKVTQTVAKPPETPQVTPPTPPNPSNPTVAKTTTAPVAPGLDARA
jgi:hypothetical protein